MENFKDIENVLSHDIRSSYFGGSIDPGTHQRVPRPLDQLHSDIERIQITSTAPEEIQSNFNIAKNLALYSWYCYPFHQIAEMKAYTTVERALKFKFNDFDNKSFRWLIKKAVYDGYIKDSGFTHIDVPCEEGTIEYSLTLIDTMPNLRNTIAHGDLMLHPWSVSTLSICSNFINQLYE